MARCTRYRGAMPPGRDRRLVLWLLVGWAVGVAYLTLRPKVAPDSTFDAVRAAIAWLDVRGVPVTYNQVEAGANVVMFAPFGVLAGLLARRRWPVVLAGAAISAGIEATQALFLPTRVATVQDVAMNTLGALVGVAVLVVVAHLRAGRREQTAAGRLP